MSPSSDTPTAPTAYPVLALYDVSPEDVTATIGGGRPSAAIGPFRINPVRGFRVDMAADLDALDAIADAIRARVAEVRRMLADNDRAAAHEPACDACAAKS